LRLVIALIVLTAWPTGKVVNAVQRGRAVDASFENGRYRHSGIAFEVPSAWTYEGTVAGNNLFDQTAHWVEPQSGIAFYAYLSTQKTAPENIAALVRDAVAEKTKQRERERYQKWHVPLDSVHQTFIEGKQALIAVAHYERRADRSPATIPVPPPIERLECLAWIFSPESRVLFFAPLAPDQLAQFRPTFDKIVQSAKLP